MIRGESGFVRFTSLARHKASWMCFEPVPSTGWSLGVIFPEDEFMEDITRLNHVVAAVGFAGMALLVLVIFIIARSITGPLHGMAHAAKAIGAGNLDAELPAVTSEDEVGQLAAAFRYMKTSLKKYISDLKETTAAKERIESELNIAREIQSSMLPHIFPPFPHKKEFELFAVMVPAKEVGGDFFDFFLTAENKLFFLIGDVSGKGVPAALFMMITKTLMKNEALQHLAPHEVLCKVNKIIALDNDSAMFATIFCGVLDTETGEVEFANAGHNPPVLCRKSLPNEFLKMDHGFVLGPMPDSQFTVQKTRLDPGDTLFMYTDGVTEAMNPQKQLFSEKRLQQVLTGLQDRDVTALINALRAEIKLYAGNEPQSDDITMLALKFRGGA
ncbi:MAG: SpoIIE family protein phosphatase [Elusimicrobia bacterium]|nr:SpoIIE family protein phosphatase [Elusimicrobiota bacterium]